MANFTGPRLIEGADGCKHCGYTEHAAADLLGKCAARIERDGEQYDHQSGEEEHGNDGVERAPLYAQVFHQVSPQGAHHAECASCKWAGLLTRSTVCAPLSSDRAARM